MDARGARCRSRGACRLIVVHALLRPEEKDGALHRRKALQSGAQAALDIGGGKLGRGVCVVSHIMPVQGEHRASLALAEPVAEHICADPEKPAPETAPSRPAVDPAERPEERVLENVLHLAAGGAERDEVASERRRVPVHELRCREFVAPTPCSDEILVGSEIEGDGCHCSPDAGRLKMLRRGMAFDPNPEEYPVRNVATPPPLVIGHRGASGHAVENSWRAIGLAVDMGSDGVEIDVHATRDGALVVHHDAVLRGGLVIAGASREQVLDAALADDSPPPLLDAVVARYGAATQIFIEAKSLPEDADDALLEVIASSPVPGNLHVHAFDHRIIARLAARRGDLSLGVLSASYPLDPASALRDTGANTLWQEHHLIDAALLQAVHGAGGRVIAWTVNTRRDAERLAALGVAGLCGNWPERLRAPVP